MSAVLLFALIANPARAQSEGPTLDQTVEWLKERLPGNQLDFCRTPITKVVFEKGWFYIHGYGGCGHYIYAVAPSSLDGRAEERLLKTKENPYVALESTGNHPIQVESTTDPAGKTDWKRKQQRNLSFVLSSYEVSLKIAKAFDHAARLSGGAKQDLF